MNKLDKKKNCFRKTKPDFMCISLIWDLCIGGVLSGEGRRVTSGLLEGLDNRHGRNRSGNP